MTEKMTIRLPAALADALEEEASGGYMDASEFVREAVRENVSHGALTRASGHRANCTECGVLEDDAGRELHSMMAASRLAGAHEAEHESGHNVSVTHR